MLKIVITIGIILMFIKLIPEQNTPITQKIQDPPHTIIASLSTKKEEEIKRVLEEHEQQLKERERISKNYREAKQTEDKEEIKNQEEAKNIKETEEIQEEEIQEEKIQEKKTIPQKTEPEEPQQKEQPVSEKKENLQPKGNKVSGNTIPTPFTTIDELSASDRQIAYKILNGVTDGDESVHFEEDTTTHLLSICQAIQDTYFYAELDSGLAVGELTDGSVYVAIPSYTKTNYEKSTYVTSFIHNFGNSLKNLTEEEAVSRINNWIRSNTYEEHTRDIYSLVHDRVGNCDSYSQFFEYVCDYIGIESKSVHGYIKETSEHMWNRVKVNGIWYYIDTTFNQTYNNEYYLSVNIWSDTHEIWEEYKRNWTNQ